MGKQYLEDAPDGVSGKPASWKQPTATAGPTVGAMRSQASTAIIPTHAGRVNFV